MMMQGGDAARLAQETIEPKGAAGDDDDFVDMVDEQMKCTNRTDA